MDPMCRLDFSTEESSVESGFALCEQAFSSSDGNNFAPGGVVLVSSPTLPVWLNAALQITLMSIVDEQKRNLYRSVVHMFSPNSTEGMADRRNDFLNKVESCARRKGLHVPPREKLEWCVTALELKTCDGDELLTNIGLLKEGTAAVVRSCERFRFPEVEMAAWRRVQVWNGRDIKVCGVNRPYWHTHIEVLVRKALIVAKRNDLLVVLFCEGDLVATRDFPQDIREEPEFAVLQACWEQDTPVEDAYTASIESLRMLGTEPLDVSLRRIYDASGLDSDKVYYAAFLLFIAGNAIKAWQLMSTNPLSYEKTNGSWTRMLQAAQIALAASDTDASHRLLCKSIEQGMESLEDFLSAISLADQMSEYTKRDALIAQASSLFPKQPQLLRLKLNSALIDGEFGVAKECAKLLADSFMIKVADSLSNPARNAELLDCATDYSQRNEALFLIGREAVRRGDRVAGVQKLRKRPTCPILAGALKGA